MVSLALQVGTNFANDLSDGVRGADGPDRVGPQRLVGSGLATPAEVKLAVLISFMVAALVGLTIAVAVSLWLLLVGAVSIAAGWFYTGGPRPYGYLGLGENWRKKQKRTDKQRLHDLVLECDCSPNAWCSMRRPPTRTRCPSA